MEMGSYTQNKLDDLLSASEEGYDADYDFSALLEKLNSPDFFAPFSKRLRRFISNRRGTGCSSREAYLFLYEQMENAGTNPNRTTVKNWLNVRDSSEGDYGPNMGDAGRESMFQVAFALGLNAAETEDFFHRVYLDKAFNARNPKEFVYCYCLKNGKNYTEAQALAADAVRTLDTDCGADEMSATVLIKSAAQKAGDEAELLSYIGAHAYNFTSKNVTALSEQERILSELKGSSEDGLAAQEYLAFRNDDARGSEGRDLHSVNFVLDMAIKGPGLIKKPDRGSSSNSVRDILNRKEISNQFPNANTISHPDSSYILRKNIIFLYFYWYWVKDALKGYPKGDAIDFFDELNGILYECGYGPLYYGNPYDWLFLYCSSCKDNGSSPLDVFRGILADDEDGETA